MEGAEKKILSEIKGLKSEILDLKTALRAHKREMSSKEVRDFLCIGQSKLTRLKKAGLLELSKRKKLAGIQGDYYLTDSVVRYKYNN